MRPNILSRDDHDPSRRLHEPQEAPAVQAQFFYFSSLSIDDPLSAASPVAADKAPPQPFSVRDNASLEECWRSCQTASEQTRDGQPLARPPSRQMFSFPSFREDAAPTAAASPHSVAEPSPRSITHRSAPHSLDADGKNTSPADGSLLISPTSDPQPQQVVAVRRDNADTTAEQDRPPTQHHHALASNISGKPFARTPSKRDTRPSPRDLQVPHLDGTDDPVVNDTSKVIRATWFYKDSMLPVPTEVANQLEVGYEYIKPYLDSYQDELDACVENGAVAEMKVVHKLWPCRPASTATHNIDNAEAGQNCQPANELPSRFENTADDPELGKEKHTFETSSVIYVDQNNAQILRPSLLPSVRQNRRPLSAIRKGRRLGVAVVRGFDAKEWQRLHPETKLIDVPSQAPAGIDSKKSSNSTATSTAPPEMQNADSKSEAPSPVPSDLILVIHGIGQKLSEKVDSFHFTYAINDVRRQVNVELSSDPVRRHIAQSTGMMLLPVNWRRTMSFDEEINGCAEGEPGQRYDLSKITPDTLPAVRSIVSDVMLDIPYYMSHHKDKMIAAVIREANRIYRLWCANNPGFREHGRVHLIGHSLGSVIAMEILGRQPTRVPNDLPLDDDQPSTSMFEFDTTNLFTCGSPCGFFLWLHNNARLIPRKGRSKPGLETEQLSTSITGDEGYGCLAVDNIYNVIHRNDPISYLVNAAVDADYAESLQPATIPAVTTGFWGRVGNTLGWGSAAGAGSYAATKGRHDRPLLMSMPSTVEMDTHNFTQEEIAEKRMYLLNDNGQIDYFLQATGGPLEIQYLSMLSAHSSYWLSPDFIRFLVMEIVRKPGKSNTYPVLRAVKKREFKKGSIA
ncbi:hypothetical protein DV738_g4927, partial [Chaetothyriales sp. CBS 135597]